MLLQIEAMNVKANYALTKLKLASMDIEYATSKYNLDNILPAQNVLLADQHNSKHYNKFLILLPNKIT
jgi:hypothetical protein